MVQRTSGEAPAVMEALAALSRKDRDRTSLNDLEGRLKAARDRQRRAEGRKAGGGSSEGMGAGLRIAVELAAAIAVGTAIGIFLDRWLGTRPWLLIVFFVLGCAAGFLNLYRTAQELDRRRRTGRPEDGDGTD